MEHPFCMAAHFCNIMGAWEGGNVGDKEGQSIIMANQPEPYICPLYAPNTCYIFVLAVPLVSRMCPSDVYKVWKSGKAPLFCVFASQSVVIVSVRHFIIKHSRVLGIESLSSVTSGRTFTNDVTSFVTHTNLYPPHVTILGKLAYTNYMYGMVRVSIPKDPSPLPPLQPVTRFLNVACTSLEANK